MEDFYLINDSRMQVPVDILVPAFFQSPSSIHGFQLQVRTRAPNTSHFTHSNHAVLAHGISVKHYIIAHVHNYKCELLHQLS